MSEGAKLLASITTDPPNETDVPLTVMLELVRLELPMLLKVLFDPDIVLFVSVCDVERSAVTPVLIERVTAPDEPPPESPVPAVTPVMSPAPM
jgi:hypothetical protein